MWPTRILMRGSSDVVLEAPWPKRSDVQSFFAFSLPKAGSSLMESVLHAIADASGHTIFSPTVALFERGLRDDQIELDNPDTFAQPGYCFSGLRHAPEFLSPYYLNGRKALLMVRDPRDMVVSLYFSMRYSHVEPGPGEYRDWFLKQRADLETISLDHFSNGTIRDFNASLDALLGLLRQANLRLYRYEDIIYRKREWIGDIARFLDVDLPDTILDQITARHDQLPTNEDKDRHFRQGHPGDGKRKLSPESLRRFNETLSPAWQWLGYPYIPSEAPIAVPGDVLERLQLPALPVGLSCRPATQEDIMRAAITPRSKGREWISVKTGLGDILGAWLENLPPVSQQRRMAYSYLIELQPLEEDVIFGCRIVDSQGNLIFGRNSFALNLAPFHFSKGGKFVVTWDMAQPFTSQRYLFSAGVSYARNPSQFIARQFNAFDFALPLIA
jgi:hypothetical protein